MLALRLTRATARYATLMPLRFAAAADGSRQLLMRLLFSRCRHC